MKKIVNHPKGVRLNGIVEWTGVGFLPIKEAGPMAVQMSGAFASIDENGKVASKEIGADFDELTRYRMDDRIKAHAKVAMIIAIVGIVASLITMFMSTSWSNPSVWIPVLMTVVYLLMIVLLLPKAVVVLVERIFRNKEMIQFSKYLGAKNAVENAYYDLGRTPYIDEVKDYSLYSAECKYTKNGYLACLVAIISVVQFLSGVWYWVGAILAILVLCVLESKHLLNFWQALVVSKPSENDYQVAIRAMEYAEDVIDSIHISYHQVDIEPDPENFEEKKCGGCPAYDFCKEANQELKSKNEKSAEDSDYNPAADGGC